MEEIIGSTGEIGKLGYKIYNIGSHIFGVPIFILFSSYDPRCIQR